MLKAKRLREIEDSQRDLLRIRKRLENNTEGIFYAGGLLHQRLEELQQSFTDEALLIKTEEMLGSLDQAMALYKEYTEKMLTDSRAYLQELSKLEECLGENHRILNRGNWKKDEGDL